jgi:WD40 repeat protein/beta-lactamase regulating signal transducer with metallopeptidase domain
MSTLLAIGLTNAVCAAALAVPAYLAGRKGRSALAHALWLLVLIKLVTPPLFRLPLPWLPADEPATPVVKTTSQPDASATWVELALPPVLVNDFNLDGNVSLVSASGNEQPKVPSVLPPTAATGGGEQLATLTSPQSETNPADEAPPAASAEIADPLPLLLLVWLAGVLLCVGRAVVLMLRFQRLLLHARLAPQALQQQTAELARQMGLRRCPAVWLVPGALPPMVWALGRARILFPAGLLERLGDEERSSLLVHELAHVRRRDHWVRWLEVLSLALYWWYPLAWWARKQLQEREEECCDGWAAQQVSARTYANAILEAVDFLSEARPRVPAVASALAGAKALRQRLTLIMTGRGPVRLGWLARLGFLTLAVAVLPLLPCLTRPGHTAAPPVDAKTGNPDVIVSALEPDPEPTDFAPNPVTLLGGNPNDTFSVAVSPDGSRIAAGSGNNNRPGRVSVWDLRTRKLLWWEEAFRGVASVAFSHDSKRLGWGGWGGQFRVEQLDPRRPLFRLPTTDTNYRVAYSRDGKWLAAAGEDRSLRLFDARTGRLSVTLKGDATSYYSVCFSNDSKLVAAGGGAFNPGGPAGPTQVNLFNVTTHQQVGKLTGHARAVMNVTFAPQDKFIATSSADNTVRIWDGKSFQFKLELRGHSAQVKGLAFSPDGSTLATGSWDRTIRLWDPATGKQLAQLDDESGMVREIAFSPDGKYLVSGGARRSVKLWDVKERKLLATLREDPESGPSRPPLTMALSPDGKVVATGNDEGQVQFRDSRSGVLQRTLTAHEDAVTALVFSGDGKLLASSGPDQLVKVWEAHSGKLLHALKGHTSWVYSLAFSRDGKKLASGSYDRTVRVWDPIAGKDLGKLTGHSASIRALAFSADGTLLATGSADQKIRLWDLRTMQRKAILKGHEGTVRGLVFAPTGRLVSAGEDGQLLLWDTEKAEPIKSSKLNLGELVTLTCSPGGQVLVAGSQSGTIGIADGSTGVLRRNFFGHNEGVVAVALGPGGRQLFSLGGDGLVKVWQGKPGPVRFLDGHTGPVRVATFSPDGKYLLSTGGWPEGDRTLRLWDVKSGKQVRLFTTAPTIFQSAAFSPDGKHAVAGENSGQVRIWEVETGKELRPLRGHKEGIPHVSFSTDGKWLLSSGHDKTVRLWDAHTWEEVRVFRGHTDWARCAVFHPDGKRILSGGRDRVVRVWDRESGKLLHSFDHAKEWVERMVVLPGGKQVLTCGGNAMRLWDLDSGKEVRTFAGHQFGVTSVALTKDGRTAFSSSYDGSVRSWDIETGVELQRFQGHRNYVWSVEISPDGKTIATAGGGVSQAGKYVAGDDFTIRLWKMPPRNIARAP